MNRLYLIIFTSLIIPFSCTTSTPDKVNNLETPIDSTIIENELETNLDSSEQFSELFNVELVGLVKDTAKQEGYYVDFSSACMCNSPSILLTENRVYLFNYCQDTLPPFSKEPFYTYNIFEKAAMKNGLSLILEGDKGEELMMLFNKSDHALIYDLQLAGTFPTDYIGAEVCKFYTFKVNDFEVEDCGEFDG